MPFFVPRELVSLEYLGQSETEETEYDETASSYSREIELAFFVVNFGYSKQDYLDLTPTERAFITKAWEDKQVRDSTFQRNAMLNALQNYFKKGKKVEPLWKKPAKKADKEKVVEQVRKLKSYDATNILNRLRKKQS